METIYGESPEMQTGETYSNNGGIALFAVDGDTVTGGSGDDEGGAYPTSTRIRWTATRTPDTSVEGGYTYVGGITGEHGWYTYDQHSPFCGYDEKKIYEHAFEYGNLNYYFDLWNEDQSQEGQIKRATFALAAANLGCATIIGG